MQMLKNKYYSVLNRVLADAEHLEGMYDYTMKSSVLKGSILGCIKQSRELVWQLDHEMIVSTAELSTIINDLDRDLDLILEPSAARDKAHLSSVLDTLKEFISYVDELLLILNPQTH